MRHALAPTSACSAPGLGRPEAFRLCFVHLERRRDANF